MTTYVLVHGAWHGAWAWERVVPLLDAPAVVLDLAGGDVGLADHADQVAAAVQDVDGEVILVGHSYAGLVVRQAADRLPDRIAQVVLVEGWAGPDGASMFDLAPDWFREALLRTEADGLLPAVPAALLGIEDPADARWAEERMRPQALRTFTEPTRLTGAVDRVPGTALYGKATQLPFADLGRALGYRTVAFDGPHDVMVTDPAALAAALRAVREPEA
ncbi:alpha/beta fold hydrolase [Actinomadura hibisca]|uniref:alpha/beta fold hydrolase n=1 Tax=Actinomadura hibisca TaxID=68565 RepID=UPI00082EA950|nr:alpha/beta fold hydrolase [Actinomadura hibisca]